MIPRIHQAELIKEDSWLIWFFDPDEKRFPIIKIVPVDENPETCPGGELWCKQFGCVPGDNVFTRAEPELLVEEGKEAPEWMFNEFCPDCNETVFQCHCEANEFGWTEAEWDQWEEALESGEAVPGFYEEGPECTAGCDGEGHRGCELS